VHVSSDLLHLRKHDRSGDDRRGVAATPTRKDAAAPLAHVRVVLEELLNGLLQVPAEGGCRDRTLQHETVLQREANQNVRLRQAEEGRATLVPGRTLRAAASITSLRADPPHHGRRHRQAQGSVAEGEPGRRGQV